MKLCDLKYICDRLDSYGFEDAEVRVGDVAERTDLHASVGGVTLRNGCVIVCAGDDDIWKDETLASEVLSVELHPSLDEEGIDEAAKISASGKTEHSSG